MAKDLPILFSQLMVEAILAGRKTMTRRIVKLNPSLLDGRAEVSKLPDGEFLLEKWPEQPRMMGNFGRCERVKTKYQPGQILYVRESHYRYGHWEYGYIKAKESDGWYFVPDTEYVLFEEPENCYKSRLKNSPNIPAWYKRNSLFMPKSATRIWLQVESVKVERVQDISQEDAKAEGVMVMPHRPYYEGCKPYADGNQISDCYVCAFRNLWNRINGDSGHQWNKNEFVFCYSFKVLSVAGKPIEARTSHGAIARNPQ